MKNRTILLLIAISTVLIYSCTPDGSKSELDSVKEPASSIESNSENKLSKKPNVNEPKGSEGREPTDEEIREYGKIINIEDGVYPMFVVTFELPERQMKSMFKLNIEAITLDSETLAGLEGKYISFYYTSELENDLADIHLNGTTLLGEYAPELNLSWKNITGVLKGAENETMSDLPDEITVTDENGKVISFEYYITPEMVAANGKVVKAYYLIRGIETITYVSPAE